MIINRNLFLVGGATMVAGGLAYWYLSQKPPIPPPPLCEQYNNQSDCENAGCYWYDGTCHSSPPGNEHECRGDCFYEDATDCDRYNNLCKCVNGEWQLLERNSPKCLSGIKHNECFPSQNNIVSCIPVPGDEPDTCENIGFSTGCYCSAPTRNCDTFHFCEPRDHRCSLKAVSYPISATSENMDCFDHEGASYCNYWLDESVAALNLIGDLFWKWGPWWPGEWIDWGIFAYYKGNWRTIKEGTDWVSSTGGSIPIIASFEAQGIEMIQFGMTALVSNIHVDKFIGHLNY